MARPKTETRKPQTVSRKLTPGQLFDLLRAEAERRMAGMPVPGAALGVFYAGCEWTASLGVTSAEQPLAVTADTLFQVGSITKTFVVTAILRLVEAGRLELDRPLRAYLPGLKLMDADAAARVTLRHLLTHTAGWMGDYFEDFGDGEDALAKMVAALASLPQITPLGEAWSYNNSAFYLAGRVIEVVTGKNFEAALRELVLDPLGMGNTWFFARDVLTRRFAVGHEQAEGQTRVARPWALGRAMHPAGGVVCSVNELLRYARFHLGDGTALDGTRLLAPKSLALMQTPALHATGLSSIGLPWFISEGGGVRLVEHGGGTNGQVSLLRLAPQRQFALAVMTNSDEGGGLCYGLAEFAMKLYLGVEPPLTPPLALSAEALSEYTGRFEAGEQDCVVSLEAGGLILQVIPKGGFPTPESPPPPPPPPARLDFYAADRFLLLDEPFKGDRGEFLRAKDGRVAWLRQDGRVHVRRD